MGIREEFLIAIRATNETGSAVTAATRDFDQLERKAKNSAKGVDDLRRSSKGAVGHLRDLDGAVIAVGGAFAGWQVVSTIADLTNLGGQVNATTNTFNALSGGSSEAMMSMDGLRARTRGVVDDMVLMQGASQLLSMELAGSQDELEQFIGMAVDLKKPTESAQDAIMNFATMLANDSVLRLDSFGISSERVKTRMAELQASGEALNKSDAFRMATLEEGTNSLDRLGDSLDANATELQKFQTRWDNTWQDIGSTVHTVVEDILAEVGALGTALSEGVSLDEGALLNAGVSREQIDYYKSQGIFADQSFIQIGSRAHEDTRDILAMANLAGGFSDAGLAALTDYGSDLFGLQDGTLEALGTSRDEVDALYRSLSSVRDISGNWHTNLQQAAIEVQNARVQLDAMAATQAQMQATTFSSATFANRQVVAGQEDFSGVVRARREQEALVASLTHTTSLTGQYAGVSGFGFGTQAELDAMLSDLATQQALRDNAATTLGASKEELAVLDAEIAAMKELIKLQEQEIDNRNELLGIDTRSPQEQLLGEFAEMIPDVYGNLGEESGDAFKARMESALLDDNWRLVESIIDDTQAVIDLTSIANAEQERLFQESQQRLGMQARTVYNDGMSFMGMSQDIFANRRFSEAQNLYGNIMRQGGLGGANAAGIGYFSQDQADAVLADYERLLEIQDEIEDPQLDAWVDAARAFADDAQRGADAINNISFADIVDTADGGLFGEITDLIAGALPEGDYADQFIRSAGFATGRENEFTDFMSNDFGVIIDDLSESMTPDELLTLGEQWAVAMREADILGLSSLDKVNLTEMLFDRQVTGDGAGYSGTIVAGMSATEAMHALGLPDLETLYGVAGNAVIPGYYEGGGSVTPYAPPPLDFDTAGNYLTADSGAASHEDLTGVLDMVHQKASDIEATTSDTNDNIGDWHDSLGGANAGVGQMNKSLFTSVEHVETITDKLAALSSRVFTTQLKVQVTTEGGEFPGFGDIVKQFEDMGVSPHTLNLPEMG